ncbi:MAG TPA: L,D-transpeptidase family protein [Actinomycetota bacterium]|nr:L,D-transpeptidase family protein [Actinomycetota bacterium]
MTRRSLALLPAVVLFLSACSSGAGIDPVDVGPGVTIETNLSVTTSAADPAVMGLDLGAGEPREPLLPKDVDVVAVPRERLIRVWEEPRAGDPDFLFDTRNSTGERAPLLVADARRVDGQAWYEVYLPIRPNGRSVWLLPDEVRLREHDHRIEVDLSERKLRYLVEGEVVERVSVGVGTPSTPTATGTFYVWVKVPYPNTHPAYGIMALGLSGFSEVLKDWPGGGRMAVHGTSNAGDRGRSVSHGCVRVYNEDMQALLDVPLGTPVIISR